MVSVALREAVSTPPVTLTQLPKAAKRQRSVRIGPMRAGHVWLLGWRPRGSPLQGTGRPGISLRYCQPLQYWPGTCPITGEITGPITCPIICQVLAKFLDQYVLEKYWRTTGL